MVSGGNPWLSQGLVNSGGTSSIIYLKSYNAWN